MAVPDTFAGLLGLLRSFLFTSLFVAAGVMSEGIGIHFLFCKIFSVGFLSAKLCPERSSVGCRIAVENVRSH